MIDYYNDRVPFVCEWLRSLIAARELPAGPVERRDIAHVEGASLFRYRQCHFFAGIGGWPYALGLAGWPEDREVWTGSCPCQPFSVAGKRAGPSDERHVWPEFLRLIAECRPATVFGEQVASPLGREWLGRVRADLEALGYAVGGADLCAAGVGAPHIRQRLFWVADASESGCAQRQAPSPATEHGRTTAQRDGNAGPSGLAHADGGRRRSRTACQGQEARAVDVGVRPRVGDSDQQQVPPSERGRSSERGAPASPAGSVHDGDAGCWDDSQLVVCGDGKARRVESGVAPLALRFPSHVGRLRGYGNAIVPQLAAEFVGAFLDTEGRAGGGGGFGSVANNGGRASA